MHECGVGIFIWSTVLAYNGDKLKNAGAHQLGRFLGRQEIPRQARHAQGRRYNLEFALMADGVKPADVYKVLATKGRCRPRLPKLSELKPQIQWWEAGAQPPQFLVAGDVAMTTPSAAASTPPARGQEPQNHLDRRHLRPRLLDHPEGRPNKDAAMKFIALAQPTRQTGRIRAQHLYGPTTTRPAKTDAKVIDELPTSPANSKERAAVQHPLLG